MESVTQLVLMMTLVLLAIQGVLIYREQKKFQESIEAFTNMERALKIAQNKLIDSEREREWLNKQIVVIFEELEAGKIPVHPRTKDSWQYYNSIMDPRD